METKLHIYLISKKRNFYFENLVTKNKLVLSTTRWEKVDYLKQLIRQMSALLTYLLILIKSGQAQTAKGVLREYCLVQN